MLSLLFDEVPDPAQLLLDLAGEDVLLENGKENNVFRLALVLKLIKIEMIPPPSFETEVS